MTHIPTTLCLALALGLAACTSAVTPNDAATSDVTAALDAQPDAALDVAPDVSPAAQCASAFGAAMPSGYFRTDGVVVAVVTPADQACAMPNRDHIVVQLRVAGAVYRLVVNVLSTSGDADVRFAELPHALPPPAWSEGFHEGLSLDYATDLGLHADTAPFAITPMASLLPLVVSRITVGAPLAIYAQGTGGASAHLVHRYGGNHDGAIVLDPQGASPRMLLFHFADQSF